MIKPLNSEAVNSLGLGRSLVENTDASASVIACSRIGRRTDRRTAVYSYTKTKYGRKIYGKKLTKYGGGQATTAAQSTMPPGRFNTMPTEATVALVTSVASAR
jgi:hypothetical protein